jgi:ethanolamine utilization protein EutA
MPHGSNLVRCTAFVTEGGRIFFSSVRRSLETEDEIRLLSVGIDIGSSTSHLLFSRLVLERLDDRYVVAERSIEHESEVLLTPYRRDGSIDARALGMFIDGEYRRAGLQPAAVDTGALILTGVAVRRVNAQAIGSLFAAQAGKLVSLSAGDALEAVLSAFGSGAAARSVQTGQRVMNVDIGGGTSKISVCENGEVIEHTALDVGARLICLDSDGRLARIEETGHRLAEQAGVRLSAGERPAPADLTRLAEHMADRLFEAMRSPAPGPATLALMRLAPLRNAAPPELVSFSGGVAEYIYGREHRNYGDLGMALAVAVRARFAAWGPLLETPRAAIRATVVGASQYTVQVSGSTIFVAPQDVLPLRNVPVVVPRFPFEDDGLDPHGVSASVIAALRGADLYGAEAEERAIALCYRWEGAATFARLDAFCRGVVDAMAPRLERGLPLILVGGSDVGGLVGIHCREEIRLASPVVSIDGVSLKTFDFIDIGALLEASGAVPVVIKSLVFPAADTISP